MYGSTRSVLEQHETVVLEHELEFTLWHSCPSWHEGFTRNPGEIPIPLVNKRLENHRVPWKGGNRGT